MTMTNDAMVHARRAALGLLLALAAFVFGCGTSHAGDPESSGSHWLTCKVDHECSSKVSGSHCGDDGVCVDKSGARVKDPNPSGDAGSHTDAGTSGGGSGGGHGSGSGGSASGTGGTVSLRDAGMDSGSAGYQPCAGKKCGESCSLCAPGDANCGETLIKKFCDSAGTCISGSVTCSAEAGVGFALPDCGSVGASAGSMCSALSTDPVPECCSASTHLRCEFDACTNSIPGSCRGTFQPQVGSKACGGYQPCAGKGCGDACTICEPGDASCTETGAAKACDQTGACISTTPDCTPPPSCDPSDVKSCGDGQACCAVGRCGPLETGEGRCETADPMTGGCTRCACESQPGGCPICNSPDTPIATPKGERAIADLREGDLVFSMHQGQLVVVPVLATRSVQVFNHAVVHLVLDNGRTIEVSGSHPTADGRRLDALQPGDALGGPHVQSIELIPYEHDRTYDILPASDTGTYIAGGALIGSTLFRR
jgi:hypothetical protein